MDKRDEELIAKLIPSHPELAKYVEEHRMLEEKLEEFNKQVYLTPEEEVERKRLQKLKLAGKDKIEAILAKYRNGSLNIQDTEN